MFKILLITGTIFIISFVFSVTANCQTDFNIKEIYQRAGRYAQTGEYDKAEKEYKNIISHYPDFAPAYNNLGIIDSRDMQRFQESVNLFLRAIELDPSYEDAYGNLGMLYYRSEEPNLAIPYLEKALELDKANFRYSFTLGWVYLIGSNDAGKASEYFKIATTLDKNSVEAHYALGMAYAGLGKKALVLEQITDLRLMNREDLASALEDKIRVPYTEQQQDYKLPIFEKVVPQETSQISAKSEISGGESTVTTEGKMKGSATIQLKIQGEEQKQEE